MSAAIIAAAMPALITAGLLFVCVLALWWVNNRQRLKFFSRFRRLK
jgi:hypothetical protein